MLNSQNLYLKDLAINSDIFTGFEIIHPSETQDFDTSKRIDIIKRVLTEVIEEVSCV